jgi:hypothetical protein
MRGFETNAFRLIADQRIKPSVLYLFGGSATTADEKDAIMVVPRPGAGDEGVATGDPRDKAHLGEEIQRTIYRRGADRLSAETTKDFQNLVGAGWRTTLQQDAENEPPGGCKLPAAASAMFCRTVEVAQYIAGKGPLNNSDAELFRDTSRHDNLDVTL